MKEEFKHNLEKGMAQVVEPKLRYKMVLNLDVDVLKQSVFDHQTEFENDEKEKKKTLHKFFFTLLE